VDCETIWPVIRLRPGTFDDDLELGLKMHTKPARPRWWVLYLVLPLTIALFWWETQAPLSERAHQAVEVIIILFAFSLVWLWLETNRRALIEEEREKRRQELRRTLEPLRQSYPVDPLPVRPRNGALHARPTAIPDRIVSWMAHFFHL
jgi:hypothetical protein